VATQAQLLEMLRLGQTKESSLAERKPDGFKDREARKVVVAFSNSTPEGQEAILWIGLDDKTGQVKGVASAEAIQSKYAKVLDECYPRINYQMHALEFEGKTVVAVVVPASNKRPHFAGGAYIREGSRCVLASERLYEELVISKSDKVRELTKYRTSGVHVAVRGINYRLGSNKPFTGQNYEGMDCVIDNCDAFRVRFYRLDTNAYFTEELPRVSISYDDQRNMPVINVIAPGS